MLCSAQEFELAWIIRQWRKRMRKMLASLRGYFCRHDFKTVAIYDRYTEKAMCVRCGNQYVLNKLYKWKFKLDASSEKDYENLRKELQSFQGHYKGEE